jgi:hypothetical protein
MFYLQWLLITNIVIISGISLFDIYFGEKPYVVKMADVISCALKLGFDRFSEVK